MGASRIRIASDKADLVKSLTASDDRKNAPFQTYADVLVFAASLGSKYKKRSPLREISKREPAPISLEIFESRGYAMTLNLLAIAETQDPQILATHNPDAIRDRVLIFEEYANGGLDILQDKLRGAVDYLDQLLLLLANERDRCDATSDPEEFDLSKFL